MFIPAASAGVLPSSAMCGSEKAGIEIKGKDKWLTIIQNATQNNGKKTSE
jgi:hypothetical protein